MWNFREIIKTGDYRYLYDLGNYHDLDKIKYPNSNKWHDIFWQYLEARGIDYKFKLRLDLQVKLELLKSEEIFEDKINTVKIATTQLKLESLNKNVENGSDIENDIILWKYMGGKIDLKRTTVAEYLAMGKSLSKENEAIRKSEAIRKNGRNNKK